MRNKRLVAICAACLLGLLPLLLLTSLTATAQGGGPAARPTPAKGATPAPAKTPQAPAQAQALLPVDLSNSLLSARGAHGGEVAQFTAIIANDGAMASSDTLARATVPWNAPYVPGSAAVQGGGTLVANAAQVEWHGAIAAGGRVTITFNVTLPPVVGTVVTNTLSAVDPGYPYQVERTTLLRIQPASAGPDAYGYTVKDSFAPGGPAYLLVPRTLTATHFFTADNDDVTATVPLSFNFSFYGAVYTQAMINTNGLVLFGPRGDDDTAYYNVSIPDTSSPNNYAACFWNDQFVYTTTQGVWVQTFGSAPNRTTVFNFVLGDYDVDNNSAPYQYQMILYETSNRIKCQYDGTSTHNHGSGGSSTIGLENASGRAGLQYFAGTDDDFVTTGPVEHGLAVQFEPGPASLPVLVESRKSASLNVHPGEVATFTIVMRNSGVITASTVHMSDPVPGNVTEVAGSALVAGPGSLLESPSQIQWNGALKPGQNITVTYRVTLPLSAGSIVTNTGTISDPAAFATGHFSATIHVLPPPVGGPDAYGYSYKDSYAPGGPVFSWLSPTLTATQWITGGEDNVFTGPVPLNFNFNFYANVVNNVTVSSNGLVLFGPGSTDPNNQPIPTPDLPNNWASCLWADLYAANATEGVWAQTFGSAPNRIAVITFRLSDNNQPLSTPFLFQLILQETSNRLKCQYADAGRLATRTGSVATIGLESPDGGAGLEYFSSADYSYETIGPLENGLAIAFASDAIAHPVFANSRKTVSGGEHPGEVVTYTLRVENSGPQPAASATLSDPIPAGAVYVPGSAAVQGGGVVAGSATAVTWNGAVAAGAAVTVTYRATLTALSGTVVNTATINAPLAVAPTVITVATPIQPYSGHDSAYAYRDSYAPQGPAFSWVPTTGASLQLFPVAVDNAVSGPVPLHFSFQFYGRTYTQVVVSSNGLVMFNQTGATDKNNAPIPSVNFVDNYATCFWDDLKTFAGGGVWIETQGGAGNHQAIITFLADEKATPTNPPLLFQMILYEQGSRLKCQYKQMQGAATGDGRSATVGIQNVLADSGLQYFFGENNTFPPGPLENGLAITFAPLARTYLPVIVR